MSRGGSAPYRDARGQSVTRAATTTTIDGIDEVDEVDDPLLRSYYYSLYDSHLLSFEFEYGFMVRDERCIG
jgi:hypothetical protein